MTPQQKILEIVESGEDSGYLPNDWEKVTVAELIERDVLMKPMDGNHGGDHPTSEDYQEEGVPFILAKNINNGSLDFEDCKKLPKDFTDNLRKGFAKKGDVILSHKGTVGRTAVLDSVPDEYVMLSPQTTYYRIIDKDKLENHYLRYYFDSSGFQKKFESWADGSTRPYQPPQLHRVREPLR